MRLAVIVLSPAFSSQVLGYCLAAAMQDQGDDVLIAACNGLQARCLVDLDQGPAPRGQRCRDCVSNVEAYCELWTGGRVPLEPLDAWLPEGAQAAHATFVAGVPDAALPDVTYRDLPIGSWVPTGMQLDRFGEHWQTLPDWPQRFRSWLRAVMAAADAAAALIDDWRPDVLLVLDGALPAERTVWEVAKARGVRTVLYESGQLTGSWFMREHAAASTLDLDPEWDNWRHVPLSVAERHGLRAYLEKRTRKETFDGTAFSPPATGELAALRHRLDLPDDGPVLVAFTAVSADALSFYAASPFGTQQNWLDACVALAAARPHLSLVVRVHPAEGEYRVVRDGAAINLPEPMEALLRKSWPVLPANVRIVGADDPVSSYDLLALADLTLVYLSTLGLEAVARGLPALVAGAAHYAGRGIVPSVDSPEALPDMVDDLLARPRLLPDAQELAWRYLYLWFFRTDVRLRACALKPWGARQVIVPAEVWEPDPALDRMRAYLRGTADFFPPPAAWRPRDRDRVRPLAVPVPGRILLVPEGLDPPTLARDVFAVAAASGSEVVVVSGGLGWSETVALCETACRRLGGPESWPAVRLLPADVPDGDWVAWVMQVQAVVMASDQGTLAAMAAEAGALCVLAP